MKYFSSSCVALVSTLFLLLITFTPTTTRAQPPATFKCSSTSSCQALVDYVPVNSTTYSDIKTLFGVENIHSIFGANSLPLSTSTNETVPAKQHIKIPFPCICNNGTGISNNRPLYSVKEGDSLDFIARTIFSNLVTYQQIATVNRIPNSVGIMVGYIELLIPLPCSCDEVDGMQVVHYEHVVRSGSSVQAIADEYGTTQSTLLRLNGLASANDLLADSVIDVPLQACTSVISNTSLDYPLVVPNGTYTFTANNCVQCTCTKANNLLECVPSPEGVNTPKQCPSMQCSNGLSLGNTSSATCGSTTCSYAGYTNDTNILTTLVGDLSCPRESRNSSKVVVIIVVPTVVVSVVFLSIVTIYFCLRRKNGNKSIEKVNEEEEIGSVESLQFNFRTIQEATNNFSDTNKLGKGGFGIVYKGVLSNGQEIAVKRLSRNSAQGIKEFKNEVILVVKLQHRNLVKLLGFCLEGDEKLLIYEFAPNGSLDHCIFDSIKSTCLDWEKRYMIIGGIARGLLYLHVDSRLKIIHRDLKVGNILLDAQMEPKISDFGMARLFEVDQIEDTTGRIVGTYGYMAPEYAMHGQFSVKSDVFSFGVLILEIVSGKKNKCYFHSEHADDLLSYAWRHWKVGTTLELIQPSLKEHCSSSEVIRCIHIGLLCVQEDAKLRPTMATVLHMLNNDLIALPVPSTPAFFVKSRENPNTMEHGYGNNETNQQDMLDQSLKHSINEVSMTNLEPR